MSEYVYINRAMVPEKIARVSPSDRGFLLGDGLFETILARSGNPVFLEAHLKRLQKGLHDLGFDSASLQKFFTDIKDGIIPKLIKKNGLSARDARVRITISRGPSSGGLAPSAGSPPTIIISAGPVDTKKIHDKVTMGIMAITIKGLRPALPGVKSLNFMPNILGARLAKKSGAEECFFLAEDNKTLLEGTSSNIFILRNKELQTTPAAKNIGGPGVLAGVVRETVLDTAAEVGLSARENWFTMEDLTRSEEVFITNSISGIVPVIMVDGRPAGKGEAGEITKKLQGIYKNKTSYFLLEKRK
ncbi:MAG: aminotransferase class IV [Thermodesulfobacteriota bacterium]